MPEQVYDVPPVANPSNKTSRAAKLLQILAMAAVLVPLGSAAAQADTIRCGIGLIEVTCTGAGTGLYSPTSTSNTWEFYNAYSATEGFSQLAYTFKIEGAPDIASTLSVRSFTDGIGPVESLAGTPWAGASCVPTFDEDSCGLFTVSLVSGAGGWDYGVTINWFAAGAGLGIQRPAVATILKTSDPSGTFGTTSVQLNEIVYQFLPDPDYPTDPAIGGKGNGFSTFGVFTPADPDVFPAGAFTPGLYPVPEPASLILLGTGLTGALYRARRRKR